MPAPPGSTAEVRDEDLMLAYAAGDAAAFDALYARHKGPLYRYLLRHLRERSLADELYQDVWMRVVNGRAGYAPTAKFTTWLYTLAHHRLVDHWRAHGGRTLVSIDDDDDPAGETVEALPGRESDEPEVRVVARETRARLTDAIATLPTVQREAFLLHQEAGLTLDEIATLTGAGAETVKSRIRYAVAKLRSLLGDLK